MSMEINKKEMDQSWKNRNNSDKFYQYLYQIANLQVSRNKNIKYVDREDYVQFTLYKCIKHQESYDLSKGSSFSFFWKQISLSISYMQRKEARRKAALSIVYLENDNLLEAMENMDQDNKGISFKDIIEDHELKLIHSSFSKYKKHMRIDMGIKNGHLPRNKENLIKVLKWQIEMYPGFLNNFTSLKEIFSNWIQENKDE